MASGVKLKLKVIPNAPRDEVVGWRGEALTIKLSAPAVEGKANHGLVKFLAKVMGVSPRDVEILKGDTSRHKAVSVLGITAEEARERIRAQVG